MTSVAELFHHRRSRFARNSDPLVVGSDLTRLHSRINRRHSTTSSGGNPARRNRLDHDGFDPLRRALNHSRQSPHHRPSHPPQERESILLEEAGHQLSIGNNSRSEIQVNGNDRLPGAVLLARERLLQRLRGVTLSGGSRRSSRSSTVSDGANPAIGDDLRLVDAGDWETEISSAIGPVPNPVGQNPSKRFPGLTQEALSRLQVEVFCVGLENEGRDTSRASRECSICLESFSGGDKLIRLPCKHRYHFCCLDPWIRTCGDCPYCRGGIDASLEGANEDPDKK